MIISSHQLIAPIGCGSFGQVWVAKPQIAGAHSLQFQALKISHHELSSEALNLEIVQLQHFAMRANPYLVTVHQIDVVRNHLVIVMDLAEGNMFDYTKKPAERTRPSLPNVLISLFRDAAFAIDYLHSKEIVHGGINPGDILVSNGHAYVADPGPRLVELQDEESMPVPNLAKSLCMAPERKRKELTIQSDQYALAASYCWLRLGYPLNKTSSHEEQLTLLLDDERQVLLKALSINPERRFSSCVEFCEAIDKSLPACARGL